MAELSDCPTRDELQRMVLGQLSDQTAQRIQRHLEGCPTCSSALDECVASRDFLEVARASNRVPSDPTKTLNVPIEFLRGEVSTLAGSYDRTQPDSSARELSIAEVTRLFTPPQSADEIGRLGDFRVLRVLGAGGFAVVFEAEDCQLKRRVALKLMRPSIAARHGLDRFLREAQSAAALKHEHVVTIYQVGRHGETPFIALELLYGETLENRLIRNEPLSIPEVVRIGREIASGLAAAHERGLLHRDIKPANIWLESSPPLAQSANSRVAQTGAGDHRSSADCTPTGKVKILDFGCAKSWEADSATSHPGMLIGTPGYMSPEQLSGAAVDPRADLFSLGCVLYRMVTGKRPFGGDNVLSVARALALEEPTPIRTSNGSVPKALSDLVSDLLEKSPADRPPSARAVEARLEAIEETLSGDNTKAQSPASPIPSDRIRHTHLRTWLIGAGIASVGALWLVDFLFFRDQGPRLLTSRTAAAAASQSIDAPNPSRNASSDAKAKNQPPQARASSAIDRLAAEWVLSQGGSVTVRLADQGRSTEVGPGDSLPAADFDLTNVRFQNTNQITGARFGHLEGLTALKSLVLTNTAVTDDALRHVQNLVSLESLLVDGTQVTDAGLKHLNGLNHLRELNLSRTRVTDRGLAQLQGLAQLETLWLGGTRVTDRGLAHVRGLAKLRVLNLSSLPVTDAGLARLQPIKTLQHLVLDQTRVTDAGLASLKAFTKLYSLYLGETRVTEAGLADLKELPNLRILGLYGLKGVTDTAVPRILRLRHLEEIDLRETGLTVKGFAALSSAQPKIKIRWSEPNYAAARAILLAGGHVELRLDGHSGERAINAISELPTEPFHIVRASLAGASRRLTELIAAIANPKLDSLEALDLSGASLEVGELHQLKSLVALKELNLSKTNITDARLAELKDLKALRRLVLDHTAIRGPGLSQLQELPELTELQLDCPELNELFLVELAGLKKLERLSLTGSNISDDGIGYLSSLSQLKELVLGNTRITASGATKLQSALPHCRVITSSGLRAP